MSTTLSKSATKSARLLEALSDYREVFVVTHDNPDPDAIATGWAVLSLIEIVKELGVSVLNADDPTVVGLKERAGGELIYFSLSPENRHIVEHLAAGGYVVILQGDDVVIRSSNPPIHVLSVLDAPITLRGVALFNTANVLAAVAALHGLGISVNIICNGIKTFHSSATQNPCRMNLIDFGAFKVIIDYGHNVSAIKALGRALPHISAGRKIVEAHGTGNRTDDYIEEFGAALASVYDHLILADIDPRGRVSGETAALVRMGALAAGFPETNIEIVLDAMDAIDHAFSIIQPGDLMVIQVEEVAPMLGRVMEHFKQHVDNPPALSATGDMEIRLPR